MRFQPRDNWIIVRERKRTKMYGQIEMVGGENSIFPVVGDVIAAGPGMRTSEGVTIPNTIKAGDVVLLNGLTARRLTLAPGDDVGMMREHEVACIIQDPDNTIIEEAISPARLALVERN